MTVKPSMDDSFIQKLKDILDSNLSNENFGVSELATEAGISRSQLHRKLTIIAGKSSSQFIREYRLQKAKEMLEQNVGTASEISYQVGFSSPTYFSTVFKKFYGYPPGEVKYQTAAAPPKKTFSKKLVGVIPIIILIAMVVFNETNHKEQTNSSQLKKTIVVLPFINDSNNEENNYFCNGIMAGIRDRLAKIPEFSVVSRRSSERYRNSDSSLKDIGKELDVNYVVEGNVQRKGDRAIISAELIQVDNNKVLWSDSYNKNISETFAVQADVIASISDKLHTILSPQLVSELKIPPTQDKLAYDHFLKGEEYRFKADYSNQKTDEWLELLNKAKLSYELATEKDTLFAEAFVGLANTIFERDARYILEENNLEMVLELTNKAIRLNPNLSSAFITRGRYYLSVKELEKAKKDYEFATTIEPDNHAVLNSLWSLYIEDQNYRKSLKIFKKLQKRAETQKDSLRVYHKYWFYNSILNDYQTEQYYLDKIAEHETGFSNIQVWLFVRTEQWEKAIKHIKEHWTEPNQVRHAWLGSQYVYTNNKESLKYFDKWHQEVEEFGISTWMSDKVYHRYGYVLMRDGQITKGRKMVRKQIEIFDQLLAGTRKTDLWMYFDLAGAYAILGEDDKAFEILNKFDQLNGWTMWGGMVEAAQIDYQFETIRDDPRFKELLKSGEKRLNFVQNQIRPYVTHKAFSETRN